MPDTYMPVQTIPVLDLGPYLAGEAGALEKTAAQLRHINETIGFLTIVNHGVPPALMAATFAEAARFHAQPLDAKMQLKIDPVMRGYLPLRGSMSRASQVSQARKPNENEAYFLKRSRDIEGNYNPGADDRWPSGLPGFREAVLAYYDALDALAQRLMPLYARALDLPADFFATLCDRPLTSLRLTHYPATDYAEDEYGIAPHTDSTFITLLAQNKVPGLQILTPEGVWIEAEVVPNAFVVNTGDVLHRWSNGRFLSTAHRAVNFSKGPRYAIPYFFHPNPDTMIDCLPGCARDAEASRFPAMTSGEYLTWFRNQNYDHIRNSPEAAY
jgi:isopenicillin N synthase-like dioxygenase